MVKVACCWDDGVLNDIRLVSLLKKYHAKATFNLNIGMMADENGVSRWTTLGEKSGSFHGFANGKVGRKHLLEVYGDFQVASHGWNHLHAKVATEDQCFEDAVAAKKYLEDLFQRECPGYAWPCGVTTPTLAERLHKAGFAYGRTVQYTPQVQDFADPMLLNPSCSYMDGGFLTKFQAAKEANGVFYFWGHSYEMLDCEGLWQQLEQKLAMLAADPEVQWIDVIDIVRP